MLIMLLRKWREEWAFVDYIMTLISAKVEVGLALMARTASAGACYYARLDLKHILNSGSA